MIVRLRRIHREFGMQALLKTLLLLFGLAAMSLMGIFMFGRFDAAVVAVAGVALGALARREIAQRAALLPKAVRAGLFVYAIVLFLGGQLGIDNALKLLVITLTTVVLFDLQFWSLSDPGVYRQAPEPGHAVMKD